MDLVTLVDAGDVEDPSAARGLELGVVAGVNVAAEAVPRLGAFDGFREGVAAVVTLVLDRSFKGDIEVGTGELGRRV